MYNILKDDNLKLRRLNDNIDDYRLLEKWYQEKEIYSHFEQRKLNLEEIKTKYYPRTLEAANVPVYIIEYDDMPIGIIQYQLVNQENKRLYELKDKNIYEVDIFIGNLKLHNKGIGKRTVNILSNYLFKEKNATKIVMCPLKDNYNAIKCYENCGFKQIKEFNTEDTIGNMQVFILMIKEN